MANKLDFPSPAELNETYTENGITWVFDGVAWVDSGAPRGPAYVYSSDTSPSSPEEGDLWFDTSRGSCYVYYIDEDSSQWVVVSAAGAQGPTGPTGPSGADGADGADGVDGAGVEVMGSVATASSLDPAYAGSIGDMFIAQDTGNGHVWDGANWDDVGGIQGPAGPAGPEGPQGIQGPAGADGSNGVDGADGSDGAQGPEGPQGPAGADGADGADGGFTYTLSGTILTITNETSAVYVVNGTQLTITT